MLFVGVVFGLFCAVYGRYNVDTDVKITGGKDTTIEEHPFQLSLEVSGVHDCGASIIRPNAALTAAHCSLVSKNTIKLRAGSTRTETGGQVVGVAEICKHPKYKTSSHDYDIAVLILDQSLSLGGPVQTVHLQPPRAEINDGTMGTVTGWGDLSEEGPPAKVLQVGHVPKISHDKCHHNYPGRVTERMFCFGYEEHGGIDPCVGDSGGPLVVHGKQVGIVSWGEGCGRPHHPAVYVKISNPEIHEFINGCLKKHGAY